MTVSVRGEVALSRGKAVRTEGTGVGVFQWNAWGDKARGDTTAARIAGRLALSQEMAPGPRRQTAMGSREDSPLPVNGLKV